MIIVKCSCGCFFTLKEQSLEDTRAKRCPNCGTSFRFDKYTSLNDIVEELSPQKIEVSQIPDDAKISVSYAM